MSEIHVHGVTATSNRGAIESAGARAIAHRDLAAIVSDADAGGTRAADLMRRHWRVLEAIAQDATVMPVRFGTAMADEQAVVEQFLAAHEDFVLVPAGEVLAAQKIALEMGPYLELYPHTHQTDGFFAAVLERRA